MELPAATSEPWLRSLDRLLPKCGLDNFTEAQCAGFRAATMGCPASTLFVSRCFQSRHSFKVSTRRTFDSLQIGQLLRKQKVLCFAQKSCVPLRNWACDK